MVLAPKAKTPLGVPAALEVFEREGVPWRTAIVRGLKVEDSLEVEVDGSPVFKGEAQGQVKTSQHVLFGLPEWRKEVGPQGFLDADAPFLLRYIADRCGGKVEIGLEGKAKRHFMLRKMPAYKAMLSVLKAFALEVVFHELDGGRLYVGPLEKSPHAGVAHRLGREVGVLTRIKPRLYYLKASPIPRLRLFHLLEVDHPAFRGKLRVREHRLVLAEEEGWHEIFGEVVG